MVSASRPPENGYVSHWTSKQTSQPNSSLNNRVLQLTAKPQYDIVTRSSTQALPRNLIRSPSSPRRSLQPLVRYARSLDRPTITGIAIVLIVLNVPKQNRIT